MEKYHFGPDSIKHLYDIIIQYKPKSVFIVHDKESYDKCGAKESITNSFCDFNGIIDEFYDFSDNPKVDDAKAGLKLFQKKTYDLIIAIGGGSVIDMAKLIRFFFSYDGDINSGAFSSKREIIPLIAIPTTSGTGSEVTHFAVVYKDKIKYSIAHQDVLPDFAIIDPAFTYKIPPYLTACTGFDALAQAIEAYWNVKATAESDMLAEKAISLIWDNLPIVVNNGANINARNSISEGSLYAGQAINITKTTAPHAFSYPFTSYYHYPHGHAVAMLFPFFIKYNYTSSQDQLVAPLYHDMHTKKMNKLYDLLRIDNCENAQFIIADYIMKLGLSLKLPDNFDMKMIIENVNIQRLMNNPRKITKRDIPDLINYFLNNIR